MELGNKFRQHADEQGAEFVTVEVREIRDHGTYKELLTDHQTYETRTVVLASGAHPRELGLPGERELRAGGSPTAPPVMACFTATKPWLW